MKTSGLQIKWQWMIAIPLGVALCLSIGCSWSLSADVEIVGKVILSDNPTSGHGGVEVSNGYVSTTSDIEGSFVLEEQILASRTFYITFTKSGYIDLYQHEVTTGYPSSDNSTNSEEGPHIVDIGTITLTKITP